MPPKRGASAAGQGKNTAKPPPAKKLKEAEPAAAPGEAVAPSRSGGAIPVSPRLGGHSSASASAIASASTETAAPQDVAKAPVADRATSVDSNICCTCNREIAPGTEASVGNTRSKQHAHRACVNAYRKRMKQNKKCKAMELAWQDTTVEDQQA